MRVYKSPMELKPSNIQKKSSINFVKNVAAPKQPKTQLTFTPSNNFFNNNANVSKSVHTLHEKYNPKQTLTLSLVVQPPIKPPYKPVSIKSSVINPPIHINFPYNSRTQIRELIAFIHSQVQNNMIFVKSENVYVDYILGLKGFKVAKLVEMLSQQREEKMGLLKVVCCEYGDVEQDNYLKNFQIMKCVGSGGFSKVFLVRGFGRLMAMKVINKEYILSNDKSNIINNQKTILSICSQHPFITKLQASFETNNFLMFVMEFCNGGQLFNLLRKVRRMKQSDAQFYFLETLCAIVYLHRKGIVYRDIKPQNIIIDHDGHVRLADYGLSKLMQENREGKTYSFCGSAEYMAPEMLLKKGHSYEIDFYCLGALLYELVVGLPPYYSRNQSELFSNIIHNELQFPAHLQLSTQLKHFLTRLLQKEVEHRYNTIEQIMADPWMNNFKLEAVMEKRLKPPYQTHMFAYNFDDSEFAEQELQILQKIKHEQAFQRFQNTTFPDFFYQSKQITDLKSVIFNSRQQGMFIRSFNREQFFAQTYATGHSNKSRKVSNSGSMIIQSQHSREPSINRLEHSGILSMPMSSQIKPTQSQINRQTDMSNVFTGEPTTNSHYGSHSKINYPPATLEPQSQLTSVCSLQHLHTTKSTHQLQYNRSQQRISSIPKPHHPLPYSNIYTSHKQPFHPLGVKLTTQNSSSSTSHIRSPNYFSVQKPSTRGSEIILDINDLRIKNQRNFSLQRPRDNFSLNLNIGGTPQLRHGSGPYLKHAVTAYGMKRSYIDGLRDKNLSSKVKKSSFKNGQKISVSMLNNFHYRN